MRALTEIILMYTAPDGTVYEQPLRDLPDAGTLIDPETGDDLELSGWRPSDEAPAAADVHLFTVTVSGCTAEEAQVVMNERISPDEDYGFDYEIGYEVASAN